VGDKGQGNRRATKAERRQRERRARIEAAQRAAARRRTAILVAVVAAVAAIVVIAALLKGGGSSSDASSQSAGPAPSLPATSDLPGMLDTLPPWTNNTDQLSERLVVLNLPQSGAAMHIHANLAILVDGNQVPVPADIGISPTAESSMHTHDTSGVVHMESAQQTTFSLGQFFDVWGVRLSPTCIGGACASGDVSLGAFLNGTKVSGNPQNIVLHDHDNVVLVLGTKDQTPNPLPSYDWSTFGG
jgi:hypothetical protein